MTEYFKDLYGNGDIKEKLGGALKSRSLVHAYILEGPAGSGRHTVALLTCAALAGDAFGGKISAGLSPDISVTGLVKDKKSIGVEQIRQIAENAWIKPNELDFKAFIIEDAQLMTAAAQNALLKMLEEPPAGVYFFLLCESSAPLLATVRSRAVVLRTQIFTDEKLTEYLLMANEKARGLYKKDFRAFGFAVRMSCGTIGGALKYISRRGEGRQPRYYETIPDFFDKLSGSSRSGFYLLINGLPAKREDMLEFIESAGTALRDITAVKCGADGNLLFFAEGETAKRFAENFALKDLIKMNDAFETARGELSGNANVQTTQLRLLSRLWEK